MLGNKIHQVYKLDIITAEANYREQGHFLYSFAFREVHPNISFL
ncbi:hypothetical protein PITCH_A980034 [uncultured Desulfobacterium sp.]|uniref:Uncharacterized protein n=1 Tax=uncultured Desulfobacterium sp. TaxID=201089 RepID=A0A445N474_9BACT|nr:hypothetical protein PITCH_A980034 [uncultured Desulfobacterium sp.]